MAKITIELNPDVHPVSSIEIDSNDILWMSGKAYLPGCSVTTRNRGVLKASEDVNSIRAKIDKAINDDNEPRQGI